MAGAGATEPQHVSKLQANCLGVLRAWREVGEYGRRAPWEELGDSAARAGRHPLGGWAAPDPRSGVEGSCILGCRAGCMRRGVTTRPKAWGASSFGGLGEGCRVAFGPGFRAGQGKPRHSRCLRVVWTKPIEFISKTLSFIFISIEYKP